MAPPIAWANHRRASPTVAPESNAISSDSVELWLTMVVKEFFQNTVFPPYLITSETIDRRVSTQLA